MGASNSVNRQAIAGAICFSMGKQFVETTDEVVVNNAQVYCKLKKGDLIEIDRGKYKHWAVFTGENDLVIHVTGTKKPYCMCRKFDVASLLSTCQECGFPYHFVVQYGNFWTVVGTGKVSKYENEQPVKSPDEIIDIAKKFLGPVTYHLLKRNCEHFAKWCANDEPASSQTGVVWQVKEDYAIDLKFVRETFISYIKS